MRFKNFALLLTFVAATSAAPVVVDRIAVVVNRHAIKLSDIDRDLRLTDFLNKAPLSFTPDDERKAQDRLIDQQIIRTEIATGGYDRATDSEAARLLGQIRTERYAGSDTRMRQDLARYGVTESELQAQLLWQLTVLRFIDDRFRAAVLVTDEDIQKYYDAHRADFHQPLDAVAASIRTTLEGEDVNKQFEAWLDQSRNDASVEYKTEAHR